MCLLESKSYSVLLLCKTVKKKKNMLFNTWFQTTDGDIPFIFVLRKKTQVQCFFFFKSHYEN